MFNKEAISGEENATDVLAVSGREEADEIASKLKFWRCG